LNRLKLRKNTQTPASAHSTTKSRLVTHGQSGTGITIPIFGRAHSPSVSEHYLPRFKILMGCGGEFNTHSKQTLHTLRMVSGKSVQSATRYTHKVGIASMMGDPVCFARNCMHAHKNKQLQRKFSLCNPNKQSVSCFRRRNVTVFGRFLVRVKAFPTLC